MYSFFVCVYLPLWNCNAMLSEKYDNPSFFISEPPFVFILHSTESHLGRKSVNLASKVSWAN